MKNKTLNKVKPLFLLVFIPIFIFACKKSTTTQPTSLKFTVTDGNTKAAGASIFLFSSESDMLNTTNQIGTQTTNINGEATFTNLKPVTYYFYVINGCKNNINTNIKTYSNLSANIQNTVSVSIAGTGTLKFVNNSSNQYRVYVNGIDTFTMNGGTTETLSLMPVSNYSIRVLQLNGYISFPTDKTYTGTLTCGSTLSTTFP